jgi:hypothetical protein
MVDGFPYKEEVKGKTIKVSTISLLHSLFHSLNPAKSALIKR